MKRLGLLIIVLSTSVRALAAPPVASPPAEPSLGHTSRDDDTTRIFRLLGKNAVWRPQQSIAMSWKTFHTQGLVKIGETFYVSSVEVLEPRVATGVATDALYDFSLDRSEGAGRGWLFKFDATGQLLGKVELTDGAIYHPGGIDYDGRHLWVPVAQYRPNSKSNVYRVDPDTLQAELVFSEDDHIGGVVHNVHAKTLHGVSWGSRRLYTWQLGRAPSTTLPEVTRASWAPNAQFYIDYQDCHYHGVEYMLCGGVGGYATPLGSVAFGGIDLVDLKRSRPAHQIPVNAFVDEGAGLSAGLALTHNAFWAEPTGSGSLRFYFMTESNDQASLLVYEATPWITSGAP